MRIWIKFVDSFHNKMTQRKKKPNLTTYFGFMKLSLKKKQNKKMFYFLFFKKYIYNR